ncbi:ricin-type beta-trefoil lectin domain protein [Planosporangium sp. 12N6]|uniref:ricin-type beta-trefoil lectin domain protein n=1 Tax=Planosporangium spinosum TaxID=3402278 RepID=UPI003CEAB616
MPEPGTPHRTRRRRRLLLAGITGLSLVAGGTATVTLGPAAFAAGETVNVYLTTTGDSAGRTVTRGLQRQAPVTFGGSGGSANQTITVNENATYQPFEGAGASFTDTAAFALRGSGALSAATQNDVMTKLFSPTSGIGVSALRNVIGSSDLAQNSYSYDTTCCDLNDFSLSRDNDIMALTKQARGLNPAMFVMASPWSAPPWMKDNNAYSQGYLQAQYYGTYAQYFVKYIQGYQAQGVPIRYVTEQNEPGCCPGYPSMQWNASGLDYFAKTNLLPALQNAGLSTKLLIGDWNFDTYDAWVAPLVGDAAIRNHPNFGGIAWHDYGGSPSQMTTVHNQYPNVNQYVTEHSGGTWVSNQHAEDMGDLIDYFRNWGRSWTKWSLAVDQNMGPHNGGCGTCTGLVTVHRGDSRSGQVDYTIEYYTMGHLTTFVRPGAVRIDSTANGTVPNVAFRNSDGSKALIAYNTSGSTQSIKVNWGGQSFTYSLPTRTSATFTWSGTQSGSPAATGAIVSRANGKCLDVTDGSTADGTWPQMWTCYPGPNQTWQRTADGAVQALGKCLDVAGNATTDGATVHLWTCYAGLASQRWQYTAGGDLVNVAANKCLDIKDNNLADGAKLQLWTCTGGDNQKWNVPA